MKQLPRPTLRAALLALASRNRNSLCAGLAVCACLSAARGAHAQGADQAHARAEQTRATHAQPAAEAKHSEPAKQSGKSHTANPAADPAANTSATAAGAAHGPAKPGTKSQTKAGSQAKAAHAQPKAGKARSAASAASKTSPSPAAQPGTAPHAAPASQPKAAPPACKLRENEQPRGGRLDVLGDNFGSAPVVRIAGKPARILIRKQDIISVQVPADSDGGEITLLDDGKRSSCGTLVIIGKNR